jgi:hypothetical protein
MNESIVDKHWNYLVVDIIPKQRHMNQVDRVCRHNSDRNHHTCLNGAHELHPVFTE